jgi:hypothetical protein
MWTRAIVLSLGLFFAVAFPAFATDPRNLRIEKSIESSDVTTLAAAESAMAGEPVTLRPDESITIRTTTTSYLKPAFGGVYTDCFPELCPMEASDDAEIPPVNWAGVQSCCQGISCFFVDGNGRHAVTDHFFRCVSANTPSSPLVQTTSQIEAGKKKAAPKKSSPKKKG